MSRIVGKITKTIYKSDNNYYVAIFKVKENDIDKKYNGKSITITGYFYDIEEFDNISITGEFVKHQRYGEQFNVLSYQKEIPEDKNSIVEFLTSDMFKGIGEAKALKIYEKLGDNAINLIKEDSSVLDDIKVLSKKDIATIVNKLKELNESTDTLISLTDLGFNISDAVLVYKNYKGNTTSVVNDDIYNLFYDIEALGFNKIDRIAIKNNIKKDDERRVKAGIISTLKIFCYETGDTYSNCDEIYNNLRVTINLEIEYDYYLECLEQLVKESRLVKIDDNYQLIEYYQADANIVKRLTYLNNKEDITYKIDLDKKIREFERDNNILYDDIQRLAIKNAFLKNILIITGGPGTGKTTIIKSIVSLYKEIYHKKNKDILEEVMLLAPTGRASKRIMEATTFKASTIHRFLKWNKDTNKFQVNEYNKSQASLVIVDEVSMLDTLLFDSLLKGLKYDTRIILVGDANQLPSVSPGEVLKDLIKSEVLPVIELKNLYRQSGESNIINLAYDVNCGDINYSLFNKDSDLIFYKADSNDLKDKLTYIMKDFLKKDYHDYQIMAPMYKTLNGINNLNKAMQDLFNPRSSNKNEILIYDTIYREGDKVLQLMNMPDDNIYNGDIGVILAIDSVKKEVLVDFDGNEVTFTPSTFMNFTLGYVISIHKSQGSEFKSVIIPILYEYGRMLYKKLIYTAVTRSKQELILIGEAEAFQKGVLNNREDSRKTNLAEKLKKRYSNV